MPCLSPALALGAALVGTLVGLPGCAAPAGGAGADGDPAAAGPAERFRMVITDTEGGVDPDGNAWVLLYARIETAAGGSPPEGRWYFEAPRLAEDLLLPGDRRLFAGEIVGLPSGFSPVLDFCFEGLRRDDDRIVRMAVDVPILEVLDGEDEDVLILPGQSVTRPLGSGHAEFRGGAGEIRLFLTGDATTLPPGSFFTGSTRPVEHAWCMTDAQGRHLADGGGGGSTPLFVFTYGVLPAGDAGPAFPVRLRWRVPRRWRVTMQRFVFEDVPLGPLFESEPGSPKED